MAVTSWRSPGTVTEDTSVGTDVITDEANVANTGSPYATISWASGTKTSSRIKATNWGFTTSDIPSGSTIDGIEFRYDRVENSSTDNLETKEIYHIDASGTLQTGTNNAITGEWPTTRATRTIGGATDKLGYTTITDANARDADFGISFRCGTIGSGTTPAGNFGVFQMRIYYTAPTGNTYNDTISESITLGESLAVVATMNPALSESVTLGESNAAAATFVTTISEAITLADSLVGGLLLTGSITEAITLGDSLVAAATFSPTLSEAVTLAESLAASTTFNPNLSESVTLTDQYGAGLTMISSLIEPITLGDLMAAIATFNATTSDPVTLGDSYIDDLIPGGGSAEVRQSFPFVVNVATLLMR